MYHRVEIRSDLAKNWLKQKGWVLINKKTSQFPNAADRYSHKRYPKRAPFCAEDAIGAEIFHQFCTGEIPHDKPNS